MSIIKPVIIPPVPIEIVLISDDERDLLALDETLSIHHLENKLTVIDNSSQTISYLKGRQQKLSLPGLIILNMNMPGEVSFSCLHEIRTDKQLMTIPTVVLTNSLTELTLQHTTNHGITGYFLRPPDPETIRKVIRDVEDHWKMIQPDYCAN